MSCGSLASPSVCQCSGSGSSKVCRQKAYDHVWRPSPKTAWDGCVRDRNQSFDVENTAPSFVSTNVSKTNINGVRRGLSRRPRHRRRRMAFQPFQYSTCPAALMPLSFNWTALETKIDELAPAGNTNVTIGLSWAFHALTPADPLTRRRRAVARSREGHHPVDRRRQHAEPMDHTGTDIDARTQQACAKVKNANIKLWTIRVINGNASLLQACATKLEHVLQRAGREPAQRRVRRRSPRTWRTCGSRNSTAARLPRTRRPRYISPQHHA